MVSRRQQKKAPVSAPGLWPRPAALIVGGFWTAGYLILLVRLLLREDPARWIMDLSGYEWMILLGGPCTLIPWTCLALRWERPAGGVLWLGAAVAALGFSFKSGPYLGRYFFGLFAVVLPQAVEGSLFLLHSKRLRPTAKKKRERIGSR